MAQTEIVFPGVTVYPNEPVLKYVAYYVGRVVLMFQSLFIMNKESAVLLINFGRGNEARPASI